MVVPKQTPLIHSQKVKGRESGILLWKNIYSQSQQEVEMNKEQRTMKQLENNLKDGSSRKIELII